MKKGNMNDQRASILVPLPHSSHSIANQKGGHIFYRAVKVVQLLSHFFSYPYNAGGRDKIYLSPAAFWQVFGASAYDCSPALASTKNFDLACPEPIRERREIAWVRLELGECHRVWRKGCSSQ